MHQKIVKIEKSLLAVFGKIFVQLYMVLDSIFEQLIKFIKNLILIGISSNLLHNMRTCMFVYRESYRNGKFSHSHIMLNFLHSLRMIMCLCIN